MDAPFVADTHAANCEAENAPGAVIAVVLTSVFVKAMSPFTVTFEALVPKTHDVLSGKVPAVTRLAGTAPATNVPIVVRELVTTFDASVVPVSVPAAATKVPKLQSVSPAPVFCQNPSGVASHDPTPDGNPSPVVGSPSAVISQLSLAAPMRSVYRTFVAAL